MTIRAALLDEGGVYLRIDELAEDQVTERHLPQITSCDLPPGKYRWIPDPRLAANDRVINPYGGAFWPLEWLKRVGLENAPTEGLAQRIDDLKAAAATPAKQLTGPK